MMVNFTQHNIATRNEESRKLLRENISVVKDLRLTGCAIVLVSESLEKIFNHRYSDTVNITELKSKDMFCFEGYDKTEFERKVRQEFKNLGFNGAIEHPKGFDTRVIAVPIELS